MTEIVLEYCNFSAIEILCKCAHTKSFTSYPYLVLKPLLKMPPLKMNYVIFLQLKVTGLRIDLV